MPRRRLTTAVVGRWKFCLTWNRERLGSNAASLLASYRTAAGAEADFYTVRSKANAGDTAAKALIEGLKGVVIYSCPSDNPAEAVDKFAPELRAANYGGVAGSFKSRNPTATCPSTYADPNYLAVGCVGPGTMNIDGMLFPGSKVEGRHVIDGTSNTLMVGEAGIKSVLGRSVLTTAMILLLRGRLRLIRLLVRSQLLARTLTHAIRRTLVSTPSGITSVTRQPTDREDLPRRRFNLTICRSRAFTQPAFSFSRRWQREPALGQHRSNTLRRSCVANGEEAVSQ